MPIPIQTPTAWGRLADLFRLTGRHKLTFDETLVGVVVVADVSSGDLTINEDVVYRFVIPASLVLVGKAVLFNGITTDSGRDIIIDKATGSAANTVPWIIHHTTNAPLAPIAASTLQKNWRQWPQVGTPPGEMFADEGALTGDGIIGMDWISNRTWDVDIGVRLGFQQGIVVSVVSTNDLFNVSLFGRIVPRL